MEIWLIWLIAFVVLVIVELLTQWVATLCMAFGALAACAAAILGSGIVAQVIWFALCTVLAFFVLMPLLRHRIDRGMRRKAAATGMDALIGRVGRVTAPIPGGERPGRVQIDGDSWQALSAAPIEPGTEVRVSSYDSIILRVEPLSSK